MTVRRGDLVKAGAVVAELESGVEEAMLRSARLKAQSEAPVISKRAELSAAEKKLERQQKLAVNQIATAQALEQAETDVAVLRGQLALTELDRQLAAIEADRMAATLERRIMRSPVTGIVAAVDHYAGENADPSTIIATIEEVEPLRVELYLPLAAYPLVKVGMTAAIRPLGPIPGTFPAEVITKDRQIDAASGLFQIQLRLPNPDLAIPAGLRCSVAFDPASESPPGAGASR